MDEIVKTLFNIQFDILGFHININDFVKSIFELCNWTNIKQTDFWDIVENLNTLLIPTALSVLVLFLMIELIKESMNPDRITWERIVMIAIKFFIMKFFVTNSFYILNTVMQICQDVFNAALPVLQESSSTDLGDSIASLISGNLIEQVVMFLVIILIYIPFMGTIVGILVQVFQRIGKLAAGFCCASIPIALGVSEDSRNSCKSFLLWIASVGFQGLIIMIFANFYVAGINSIQNAEGLSLLIAVTLANGLFMALVSYSSTLAEKFLLGH